MSHRYYCHSAVLIAAVVFLSFGRLSYAENTKPNALSPEEVAVPHARQTSASILLPENDQKKFYEAWDLINTYDFDVAYKIIVDLQQRNPGNSYPFIALAELKRITGSASAEVMALARKALSLDPQNPYAHVVVARILLAQDNFLGATSEASFAVRLAPQLADAHAVSAEIATRIEDFTEAEDQYRKAIAAQNNPMRKSNMYFHLGEMYLNKRPHDLTGAAEAYSKAAEFDPNNHDKLINIGLRFAATLDDRYKAMGYFKQALKIFPNSSHARVNIALLLYEMWGESILNKTHTTKTEDVTLTPEEIYSKTGVSPEYAFVKTSNWSGIPYAPLAMLKKGVIKDVDVIPDGCDNTALLAASAAGQMKLVKMLLKSGANINAEHKGSKETPIYNAVNIGDLEMVKYLVEQGAQMNHLDSNRNAISFTAIHRNNHDPRILKYLLAHGADPNAREQYGQSLLINSLLQNDLDAARLLIEEFHANANDKEAGGTPALAILATYPKDTNPEIVEIFIKAGANPWVKYQGQDILEFLKVLDENHRKIADVIEGARKQVPRPDNF